MVQRAAEADTELTRRLGKLMKFLRITAPTLNKLCERDGLRALRVGARLRFRRSDLDDFLNKLRDGAGRALIST